MCPLQNKHNEQIEKNFSGICWPPLRAFQQTCGFPEEWQRPSLHQQVSSNFTSDLKAKVNSLGTAPQNGSAYTKIYIYTFLRWFSPTLHHRGLYSSNVSTEQDPQIPAACMGAPSFLLQSVSLPPYFQLLFLQQLFTVNFTLLGDASCTDPEENGTGSRAKGLWKVSQPYPLPQSKL